MWVFQKGLENNTINIFNEDWKSGSAKIVQKSEDYMFMMSRTGMIGEWFDNKKGYFRISMFDMQYPDELRSGIKEAIENNLEFWNDFNKLCVKVIDKDFVLFRIDDEDMTMLDRYKESCHGSGVSALFWLYLNIYMNSDVDNFVIDYIDGYLHPVSMRQLYMVMKTTAGIKTVFLMNQDVLFTQSVASMGDLYIQKEDKIANIRNCTERELRMEHNLQKLLRAGEFEIKEENK